MCSLCPSTRSPGSTGCCSPRWTWSAITRSSRWARAAGTTASTTRTRTACPRALSQLWPDGSAPWYITYSIMAVRLLGSQPMYSSLRMAWDESRELHLVLGE